MSGPWVALGAARFAIVSNRDEACHRETAPFEFQADPRPRIATRVDRSLKETRNAGALKRRFYGPQTPGWTNPVRNLCCEFCVVGDGHDQTYLRYLKDLELGRVQRGA
jgi:hypothetical protein